MALSTITALSGATVLIVEDDSLIARDLAATVEAQGASVVGPASDTDAALRLLEHERPDIAVLNVGLAAGSGVPVARRLCELGVPFVVVSGYNGEDILSPFLRVAPYLSKPCSPAQVLSALAEGLHGEAARKLRVADQPTAHAASLA
jgi:DNA-binding response OmpR family regulator